MNEAVTQKDLEQVKSAIIEAVDFGFQKTDKRFDSLEHRMDSFEHRMDSFERKIETEMAELRQEINHLATTLDRFLKRLTDHEQEFAIMKAEMDQIKSVLKQKLGVEINASA